MDFKVNLAYNHAMKKLLVTILCSIFVTNSSQAITLPKLTLKKQKQTTEETIVQTENIQKEKKNIFSIKSKITIPKCHKDTKEKNKANTNTETNTKPKSHKFNVNKILDIKLLKDNKTNKTQQVKQTKQKKSFSFIKNKKTTYPTVGEEMISKEQIKEELLRVEELSQQAVAFYNDNNLEEALNSFLKIPEKYRTAQDYVLIGNILLDLEKSEDAVFMYKRAILTDEFYYKPYYNIGNVCLNDDKFFMAIDYYKKAIKYAPDFAYAYYNLGCAYIKIGELTKAKSKLTKAIKLKNTEADFHYNLAYVYKKLNKPKLANIYLENYNKLTNDQ